VSRYQRLNELTVNNTMIACLSQYVHIDKQILIIDGNLDPVTLF